MPAALLLLAPSIVVLGMFVVYPLIRAIILGSQRCDIQGGNWLKRFGVFAQLGENSFYPTLGTAVSGYVAAHAVDWVDPNEGK